MVKEDCRKLCERNFCLSFERCLLKLIVRFLYIKGVVVGMSLKILIQLCYFLRYITIQHLHVKSWKFNLISLSMCSKKSARDTPITRKKKSIFIFSICLMTWFFFISTAALLQSLTPNTIHFTKRLFDDVDCCFFHSLCLLPLLLLLCLQFSIHRKSSSRNNIMISYFTLIRL